MCCGRGLTTACSGRRCAQLFRPGGLPDDLIVVPDEPAAGAPAAKATIYRDGSFTGTLNYRWVGIDGAIVGRLAPLQRVDLSVTPGDHDIALRSRDKGDNDRRCHLGQQDHARAHGIVKVYFLYQYVL